MLIYFILVVHLIQPDTGVHFTSLLSPLLHLLGKLLWVFSPSFGNLLQGFHRCITQFCIAIHEK